MLTFRFWRDTEYSVQSFRTWHVQPCILVFLLSLGKLRHIVRQIFDHVGFAEHPEDWHFGWTVQDLHFSYFLATTRHNSCAKLIEAVDLHFTVNLREYRYRFSVLQLYAQLPFWSRTPSWRGKCQYQENLDSYHHCSHLSSEISC